MPQYLLNPAIQASWGGAKLVFWRMAFEPTYDDELIRRTLEDALEDIGILTYALYDIFGEWDVVGRIWVPYGYSPLQVDRALREAFRSVGLFFKSDYFEVDETYFHWIWFDCGGQAPHLKRETLKPPPGYYSKRLNATLCGAPNGLSEDEIATAKELCILREIPPHNGSVKFFILLTARSFSLGDVQRSELATILADHCAELILKGTLPELTVYSTCGAQNADFLIVGRVQPTNIHRTVLDLIAFINESRLRAVFGLRPYTFIASNPDHLGFKTAIPSITSEEVTLNDRRDIKSLLLAGESDVVEVKATAFVDVNRSLFESGDLQYLHSSDDLFVKGIVRTVAAFLNSSGGDLIVGALEREPLHRATSPEDSERIAAALASYPVFSGSRATYTMIGIDLDVTSASSDTDEFLLKVQSKLEKYLGPIIYPKTRVCLEEVDGVTVMRVAVLPLAGASWCYFSYQGRKRFVVRYGASSHELEGEAADKYRQLAHSSAKEALPFG